MAPKKFQFSSEDIAQANIHDMLMFSLPPDIFKSVYEVEHKDIAEAKIVVHPSITSSLNNKLSQFKKSMKSVCFFSCTKIDAATQNQNEAKYKAYRPPALKL